MIPNVKYLYQYGNAQGAEFTLVLPKGFSDRGEYSAVANTGVKTVYGDATNLQDGQADLIPGRSAFKQAYTYDIEFPIGEYEKGDDPTNPVYDLDYINACIYDRPKYLFAYTTDKNGDINRFLYTPNVRAIATPPQYEEAWNNLKLSDFYYPISFQPQNTYWYDCTDIITYYDYATYVANLWRMGDNLPRLMVSGGSGQYFMGATSSSTGTVAGLSQELKNLYFKNWNNNYLVAIEDRFFANNIDVTTTNYIINQSISAGTTDITCNNVLSSASARNDIYLIDFEPIGKNESLAFNNLDNGSGIRITWLDTANANDLRFNSYTGLLYDKTTKNEIDQPKYRVEVLSSYSESLYFWGTYNPRSLVPNDTATLRVVSTASGNISTQIDILNTIH
jgi:hypothetical protein